MPSHIFSALQGTFKLGVSSQPKITASIGGGYNIGTSVDYYFYAKISDFSINTVIRAFNWRAGSLPQWFKDVEFNGVKAGLSLPTGNASKSINVGFRERSRKCWGGRWGLG